MKMAWRPAAYLIEGELDNTALGRVSGWMRFAGVKEKVTFDLAGDFHRDIRGTKIWFRGDPKLDITDASACMEGFALHQTGKVGDMTAGLEPRDYVGYPYLEWYGDRNGRVVIELEPEQIQVIGTPILSTECEPISREEQNANLFDFGKQCAKDIGIGE